MPEPKSPARDTFEPEFKPGFRLSEIDVGIIVLGFVASPLLGKIFDRLGIAALLAVAHFFLFCNVLRMNRPLEILWALSFIGLWSCSYLYAVPSWAQTYLLVLGLTSVVTIAQILLPSYHGAFWSVLNPKLPQWWEARSSCKLDL